MFCWHNFFFWTEHWNIDTEKKRRQSQERNIWKSTAYVYTVYVHIYTLRNSLSHSLHRWHYFNSDEMGPKFGHWNWKLNSSRIIRLNKIWHKIRYFCIVFGRCGPFSRSLCSPSIEIPANSEFGPKANRNNLAIFGNGFKAALPIEVDSCFGSFSPTLWLLD